MANWPEVSEGKGSFHGRVFSHEQLTCAPDKYVFSYFAYECKTCMHTYARRLSAEGAKGWDLAGSKKVGALSG